MFTPNTPVHSYHYYSISLYRSIRPLIFLRHHLISFLPFNLLCSILPLSIFTPRIHVVFRCAIYRCILHRCLDPCNDHVHVGFHLLIRQDINFYRYLSVGQTHMLFHDSIPLYKNHYFDKLLFRDRDAVLGTIGLHR